MAGPPVLSRGAVDQEGAGGEPEPQRWCVEEPCRRRPFFGLPGGKPMYCAPHARNKEGMVDVSSRRCEAVGCAKWPLYGNEGEKAKFCSIHKSTAMIDVRSRRCAEPGCKRQPSYGFEGKRACYCAAHKLEGQVDVVSRRCEEPGCRRRPLYGYEGQKSQFCSAHKQEGQVDVCNRRCQHPGCSKRPCFGLPGQRPCFCGSHRSPEMVDVISHKCAYPGCSHPTGHEANRVRSKFCDKHKSVGLAGASLLQLAGGAESSASSPAPTGTGQNAANSPPPEGATAGGGPWISGNQMRGGGLPAGADEQQPPASVQQKHAPAAAEPRTRRASFNAPAVAPIIQPVLPDLKTQHTRRSSMPAPLLPSVQSLLDDIPHGGLKRQRDEGRARQQPYDTDADSATSSSSSPLPPPPGPPEDAAGFARPGPAHVAVSGSAAEKRGGREGRVDESGRDASSVAADGASAQARTPKKTTSLFSGPAAAAAAAGNAQQQDGERATRRKVWNPHQSPPSSTTGYVTSSPAMNWRRDGVATLGRAASFDEARLAERKSGMQSEDSSKPRRASAFVTHGSALPPRVIEMHRRDSAYETRTVPAGAGRVAHYSDLLSANASSRSVTAFNGRPGYSPSLTLAHPDAVIEEEAVAGAAAAGQREDGAGAGAPSGGGRPPMPGSRAAARMFHVMPATAVFAGDLPSYARGETPSKATTAAAAASSAAQAGGGGGRRRWSVLDPAGPAAKEGGGAAATLVAAWGAPVDEGTEDKDDAADAGTTSAVEDRGMGSRRAGSGVGNVGEYQAPNRHPRRGSMMTPAAPAGRPRPRPWPAAAAAPPNHQSQAAAAAAAAAASAFVPAWGAPANDGPGQEPRGRSAESGVAGRRDGRRAGGIFGGGDGGALGGESGNESGTFSSLPQRPGLSGVAGLSEEGGPPPAAARRGSMMAPLAPIGRRDQKGPSTAAAAAAAAASVPPSWGAPPAPRRASVCTSGGPSGTPSQRRGSFVVGMAATMASKEELPSVEEGIQAQRQRGFIMVPTKPEDCPADVGGGTRQSDGQRRQQQQQQQLQQQQQQQQQQHSRRGCMEDESMGTAPSS